MKHITLALALLATPALAAPIDDARAHFAVGDFDHAQATAVLDKSTASQLYAAEVMAARIMLMDGVDAKDTAKDALDIVEGVLKREPGNQEALFLRAMHQGFRTRSSSKLAIVVGGMIGDTKDDIEAFASAAPDDARADALRGAWHLGIVRAAGDGKFGASLSEGMAAYDRAVAARPDDITVMSNYAFSLIVMDDPALRPRAEALLGQIAATEARDPFEAETKARMRRLAAVFDDEAALRKAAKGLLNTEE